MTGIDDAAADAKRRGGKNPAPKSPTTSEPASDSDLLTITIQAKTGQIIKIQSAEGGDGRNELSDQERADLLKKGAKDTLEALIEQAFEAGIACVLGDAVGRSEAEESEEEADLRHLLLEPLSRPSRNQTGISNALHPRPCGLFLDDLPIHIRPDLPAARVQT